MANIVFYNLDDIKNCLIENGIEWDGKICSGVIKRDATNQDFMGQGMKTIELLDRETMRMKKYYLLVSNMVFQICDIKTALGVDGVSGKVVQELSTAWMNYLLRQGDPEYATYLQDRYMVMRKSIKEQEEELRMKRLELRKLKEQLHRVEDVFVSNGISNEDMNSENSNDRNDK